MKKVTEKKAETWFTEDESDEALGIETMHYENGSITKRCTLSDGRIAISHRLKGKDRELIRRITGGESSKVQDAVACLSTKIDDKAIVLEDLADMWFNDATKISTMASTINFL
jgi:hypothetical protein